MKQLLTTLLITLAFSAQAQVMTMNEMAAKISAAVEEKNLAALMSFYADSVKYSDPTWGSTDVVSRQTVEELFKPTFYGEKAMDIRFESMAVNEDKGLMVFRSSPFDPNFNEVSPFTTWLRVIDGKIVEQTDFVAYPSEAIKRSKKHRHLFAE